MSADTYPPSPPSSRSPSLAASPPQAKKDVPPLSPAAHPLPPTPPSPGAPADPATPPSPLPAPLDAAPVFAALPPLSAPSPALLGGPSVLRPTIRREDLEFPSAEAWQALDRLFPDVRRVDVKGTLARAREAPPMLGVYDRVHALALQDLADRTDGLLEDAGLCLIPSVVERVGQRMGGARDAVLAAEGLKENGNVMFKVGKHDEALGYYLEGLGQLWPWTGTTAISFEDAAVFGIIQIEQALCLNIALILLRLSPPPRDGSLSESRRLARLRAAQTSLAVEWCDAVIAAPYATATNVRKALLRRAEAVEAAGGDAAAERARAARVVGNDEWVHARCVGQHVCV